MSASGCVSKWSASAVSSSAIWSVELGDDADRGGGGGPERGRDRSGCGEVLGAQRGLDLAGPGVDVALAASGFERDADLGQAQPGALIGGRGAAQHGQRVAVGEVSKASSAAG